MPGRHANLDNSRDRPATLAVSAVGSCVDIFFLLSIIFLFVLPFLARYRLK